MYMSPYWYTQKGANVIYRIPNNVSDIPLSSISHPALLNEGWI